METELDDTALTKAHLAVEDMLIELRDSRIGTLGHANGFVVNEYDGTPSNIMRMGTRDGLRIGIRLTWRLFANKLIKTVRKSR